MSHWNKLETFCIIYFQGALSALLQGHELELVVAVGHLLGGEDIGFDAPKGDTTKASEISCVVDTAVRYLTYRAIRLSLWELAMELALLLPEVSISSCLPIKLVRY